MAKLPQPDLDKIRAVPPTVWQTDAVLWRVHQPRGNHPLAWNQLRRFGPLRSARFDYWFGEQAPQEGGVGYFGFDVAACLAEVFQARRRIDALSSQHHLTAFTPTRELSLLDLRTDYPVKVGASHSINSGPKRRCREWARALRSAHPDLDGFAYIGLAGRDCVVLFETAQDAFPTAPEMTRALSDRGLAERLADAADQIGYSFNA